MAVLSRRFYARPALAVAADLIGTRLVHRSPFGTLGGVIVEVEAYGGAEDAASHAKNGPTPRNRSMFGPPGHAYVYFIYGMHHCLNVVTGREGEGAAVLLRAIAPSLGGALWRGRRSDLPVGREASGPGRLARALGLTRAHDGLDLLDSPLIIRPRRGEEPPLSSGPRIGIRLAREIPGRIWWTGHPAVSRTVSRTG